MRSPVLFWDEKNESEPPVVFKFVGLDTAEERRLLDQQIVHQSHFQMIC
jgi:hypothetical protein